MANKIGVYAKETTVQPDKTLSAKEQAHLASVRRIVAALKKSLEGEMPHANHVKH